MAASPASSARVAYLTGEYPKASHTFIQREIAGVRAAGLEVFPCSVREVPPSEITGAEERKAQSETFYILKAARNPIRVLVAHIGWLVRAPVRYVSGLGLAMGSSPPGLRALLYQLFYFAEAGLLADYLRNQGVNHIHNHFADSSCSVAMIASRISGIPFSFTMHGPSEFFAMEKWRLDLKVAQARFVACISNFCRSQLMLASDPSHWKKLKIVHCGIDPSRYQTRPRETGECVRLLYVGRLTAIKGIRVLIDALSEVSAGELQLEARLVGDGDERSRLEAEVRRRGLEDNVHFLGYLSQGEVADQLRHADILLLPSFSEGVPVVLMEAMASSLPVIATQVGGVSELVDDDVSGIIVAPGDSGALAAAIRCLAADADRRERMGKAGRAKVVSEFSLDEGSARIARYLGSE